MEWMDTADIFLMGGTIGVDKKHILEGGTPHMICSWGKQLGWGHRTTLKVKAEFLDFITYLAGGWVAG